MKKLTITLLSLGLLLTLGCDEPAEEPAEEPPAVEQQQDEAVEQDDELEPADDEEAHQEDEEADEDEYAQAEDGVIEITATESEFIPSRIKAPAGEELTLEFTRETADGCMTEVVFPDLEIEEELPEGETVAIEVTPDEEQEIGFECGMGMGQSTIVGG